MLKTITFANGKTAQFDDAQGTPSPADIEHMAQSAGAQPGQSFDAGSQPDQQRPDVALAEKGGSAVLSGAEGFAKDIAQSTADDFKGLGNLVTLKALRDSQHDNLWQDIGGSIGALSDIAIIGAASVTGETAAPAALAGKEALETGAKKLLQKGATKVASTAGMAASNASESFSKAKADGKGTPEALVEGGVSGVETLATLGLLNKFGPPVGNYFLNMFSKTKFATASAKLFQNSVDILKNTVSSKSLGDTGHSVTSAINAAASKIALGTYSMLGKVATGLKEPGENTVGALADSTFRIVNVGSDSIERQYGAIGEQLAEYQLPKTLAADIEKTVGGMAAPTKDELQQMYNDEIARMTKAGETSGMSGNDMLKQAKTAVDATLKKVSDAGDTLSEEALGMAAALKKGAKVTAADAYRIVNKLPEDVKDTQITDKLQRSIEDALSKTPEGKKIWDALRNLSNRRSENQAQRQFASALTNAKGNGWRSSVDQVFGLLKNSGDVKNLMNALGPVGMQQYQDMLTKRIMEMGAMAYKKAVETSENGVVTPEVLTAAQKAATEAIDKYLAKIPELPGLLGPEREQMLYSLKSVIPNMETIAKNAGIPTTFEEGKMAIGNMADKQTLDLVTGTQWYKAMSDPAKFTKAPAALFQATVPEIQAIKKVLGADSDEWKAIGASALGHIWEAAKGVWGETDADTIEKMLEKISAKVGGSEEKYTEMFDAVSKDGKKVSGHDLLDSLVKFAKDASKKGAVRRGLANIAGGFVAQLAHHPFMMINQYRKGAELLTKEEDAFVNDFARKSKATLRKETSDAIKESKIPQDINRFVDIAVRTAGILIRYEVRQKLSSTGNPQSADSADGSAPPGSQP